MAYLFFFFFSSRRRHTRSLRDWSSDVCSSDLRCQGSLACELDKRKAKTAARRRERRSAKASETRGRGIRVPGMLEAEKQFRKIIGYTDLPRLAVAIERRLHLPQPSYTTARRPPSQ